MTNYCLKPLPGKNPGYALQNVPIFIAANFRFFSPKSNV